MNFIMAFERPKSNSRVSSDKCTAMYITLHHAELVICMSLTVRPDPQGILVSSTISLWPHTYLLVVRIITSTAVFL